MTEEEAARAALDLLRTRKKVERLKVDIGTRVETLELLLQALKDAPERVYLKNPTQGTGLPEFHPDHRNAQPFEWQQVDLAETGRMLAEYVTAKHHQADLEQQLEGMLSS